MPRWVPYVDRQTGVTPSRHRAMARRGVADPTWRVGGGMFVRRVNSGAAALVAGLLGVGVLGVIVAEPVSYRQSEVVTEVEGTVQERGAHARPPLSVDFRGRDESPAAASPDTTTTTTTAVATTTTTTTTSLPPSTSAPLSLAPIETLPPLPETTVSEAPLSDRVLAAIDYPVTAMLPGWRIEFLGARKGYRGSVFPGERLVQIYVRDEDSLEDIVHVAAHEIGHAVDVEYMSPGDRAQFNVARGRAADYQWWVESGGNDFASGSGDWAECFAAVVAGDHGYQSQLGQPPTPEQAALVRTLARA